MCEAYAILPCEACVLKWLHHDLFLQAVFLPRSGSREDGSHRPQGQASTPGYAELHARRPPSSGPLPSPCQTPGCQEYFLVRTSVESADEHLHLITTSIFVQPTNGERLPTTHDALPRCVIFSRRSWRGAVACCRPGRLAASTAADDGTTTYVAVSFSLTPKQSGGPCLHLFLSPTSSPCQDL